MDEEFMLAALALAKEAFDAGEVPVGCVITRKGQIVGRGRNRREEAKNALAHAEIEAINDACANLSGWRLWECTLYVTLEPCAMCAGAIYWANVGRVVYAMTERDILGQTGDSEQNPPLDTPCRQIFGSSQKDIEVVGPFPELVEEAREVHKGYWD